MSTTLEVSVAASSDDGMEYEGVGEYLTQEYTLIGQSSGVVKNSGYRFLNITIPKGSTINVAYIKIKAEANGFGSTWLTKIFGEAADNPPTFDAINTIHSRVRTSAGVDWDPESWFAATWYQSPSIVGVVNEIIGRPGWESGNALVILHDNDGTPNGNLIYSTTWDLASSPVNSVLLHVEYTPPAGGSRGFIIG